MCVIDDSQNSQHGPVPVLAVWGFISVLLVEALDFLILCLQSSLPAFDLRTLPNGAHRHFPLRSGLYRKYTSHSLSLAEDVLP